MQLQHVFQTTMKLTIPDQFDQLCQWMDYRQFATIDDLLTLSIKILTNSTPKVQLLNTNGKER